jgi:hypothetical protein
MAEVRSMPGGADLGAERDGDTVVRVARPWTPSVHRLIEHLAAKGFTGSPRPLGIEGSRERLTYLDGDVVGTGRPWPPFVHSDEALVGVAYWLRRYHEAVVDFVPPPEAVWREQREPWRPGLIIAHNDAAPYNCVWAGRDVVGFVDWDMAGPRSVADDVAWVAFSWVPLHTRPVVMAEGYREFGQRLDRLRMFLDAYGWQGDSAEVLATLDRVLEQQIDIMHARAAAGDHTYERMLELGRHKDLAGARAEVRVVGADR